MNPGPGLIQMVFLLPFQAWIFKKNFFLIDEENDPKEPYKNYRLL